MRLRLVLVGIAWLGLSWSQSPLAAERPVQMQNGMWVVLEPWPTAPITEILLVLAAGGGEQSSEALYHVSQG